MKMQKKLFFLSLTFSLILNRYLFAKSKKTRKISVQNKKKIISTINKKQSHIQNENFPATDQTNKKNADTNNKNNTDNITKYNCENFYIKCMDKSCFKSDNGRCSCNSENLFSKAHQNCKYIFDKFPYLENEIIGNYKRTAKQHCSSYAINNIKGNYITTEVAELTECMKKKCNSKQGAFINCFDKEKYEQKLKTCGNTYKDSNNKDLVLEIFDNSMMQYKTKYCNENFGTLKNGECYITIGIGPSLKVIRAQKELKIGDVFICSEEFFNTNMGHSKILALQQKRDIALYALDLTKTVNNVAHTIAFTAVTGGSGAVAATEVVSELVSGTTGSEHFQDAVVAMSMKKEKKQELSKYNGACYIMKNGTNKLIAEMSNEFYYTLKWTSSWLEDKREVNAN